MSASLLPLFLGTFVLEDVALASALALIAQGTISFSEAFLVCILGIGIGDIGIYVLGRFSSKLSFLTPRLKSPRFQIFLESFTRNHKIDYLIILSRAIPGTRVPTYFAAGVLRYSFQRFCFLTVVSVSAWVFFALRLGEAFLKFFKDNLILSLIVFFIFLSVTRKCLSLIDDKWKRKSFFYSWRKWIYFEFWPAWFFYIPIIPYYLFLSLKYRSLFIPFYANPLLKHGGLIGESKWDFLKHLDPQSRNTLPVVKINKSFNFNEVLKLIEKNGIQFPLVAKPDVGQRGFGVRILTDRNQLQEYIHLSEGEILVQQKSQFFQEAGVFYVRYPGHEKGFLFSITDKKFPFVIGDGISRLGDLILGDPRARIISGVYFERHREHLDQIIAKGEKYLLSECGNHCQGALFLDGQSLATPELLQAIELVARRIPDFYFGRFDLRYQDSNSFMQGENFEIIEVNGAGAEATHIWDRKTKLWEAYRVLFVQWNYLFSIGAELKRQGRYQRLRIFHFIFDCAKVFFRKGPLTTSS